jgi:HK97 family phage major capsid protein
VPSVAYIRHTSTTGAAAIAAEGAAKPELIPVIDRVTATATAQKIAAHSWVSWEAINDWDAFLSYIQGEVLNYIVNCENLEILNGDSTTGHLFGLLHTTGILTHATGSGTPLDALEIAIAMLRTGAALATADLLILHPSAWSAIRRTKDLQDRYLAAPDPTVGEANSAWGIPVLVTTQLAAGAGVLLDTRKFGRVLVREPLNLRVGYSNDDFTKSIVRTVGEERLALSVERPAAVLSVTGLPTS